GADDDDETRQIENSAGPRGTAALRDRAAIAAPRNGEIARIGKEQSIEWVEGIGRRRAVDADHGHWRRNGAEERHRLAGEWLVAASSCDVLGQRGADGNGVLLAVLTHLGDNH